MFEGVGAAFGRLFGSQKTLAIAIAALVNVAAVFGFEVDQAALTEGLGAVFNGGVSLLVVGQFILDAIHGSASDGTVVELAEDLGLDDELEDLRGFVGELKEELAELQEIAEAGDVEGAPSAPANGGGSA